MLSRRDTGANSHRISHMLLVWLSACAWLTCASVAQAVGLGELRVQSMLGQPLRASIPILGSQPDNVLQVCVKAKVLALDGTFLLALRVAVNTDPRGPALLLSSTQNVQEPAVTVLIEVLCDANISRNYQILLDPPETAMTLLPARTASPGVASPVPSFPAAANAGAANKADNKAGDQSGAAPSRAEAKAARKAARAAGRAAAKAAAAGTRTPSAALGAADISQASQASAGSATAHLSRRQLRRLKAAAALEAAGQGMKSETALSRPPASAKGALRNVLKISGDQGGPAQDLAGNPLPGVSAASGRAGGAASAAPLPDGPNLKLLITRRLGRDSSPISKAQEQAFSETLRQEQNNAVLMEVGKAELRTLQKQIDLLEAELKLARQQAANPPAPAALASSAAALASAAVSVAGPGADASPASAEAEAGDAGANAVQTGSASPVAQKRTQNWLIGLAALLLMCLLAIVWLLLRLLQLRARQISFTASLAPGAAAAANTAAVTEGKAVAAPSVLASMFAKTGDVVTAALKHDEAGKPAAVAIRPVSAKPASVKPVAVKAPAVSALRVAPSSVALPSLDGPPELYKAEKVAQADEPLEFTFPDELELKAIAAAKREAESVSATGAPPESEPSLQGVPRNSIDYATETEIPQVEEFTDVMYEAEFWISLNKLDNAIHVLEQYTAFENVSSPLPWLFLFDMYRKTDGHDQYTALQRQFQRMFNGKIPDWEDYDTEHQNMGLEQMAGLMARVEAFWMTDEIVPFLESLLVDDRDGTRQGFELGVYRDILFLTDIAKEVQKSSEYEKLSSVFKLAPLE